MANSCGGSNSKSSVRNILTAVDIKLKMDALVSDLTHALDESQLSQYHRKRRGFKRRSKICNSVGSSLTARIASEDSSSSIGEVTLSQDNKSSIPLSDSDDLSPPPDPRLRTPLLIHHRMPANLVESDSVNENFSPAKPHNKRKQKCKRMAVDPDAPSTSAACVTLDRPSFHSSFRKRKSIRPSPDNENKFIEISVGKRKRGRDRSMDWDYTRKGYSSRSRRHSSTQCPSVKLTSSHAPHMANEEYMDLEYSNESNTSSESETGIYTCDEGREADDEQSDWFAEPGAVYGVPGAESASTKLGVSLGVSNNRLAWWNDENISLSPATKALFTERYETMSQESQHACRLRFQKLRERLLRREIRAGRRRLQERRPGFAILSSVNEKVSRFLQNPGQSELHLKPMAERDRDQLKHLAKLYSLTVKHGDDQLSPILTKTSNTVTTNHMDVLESSFPGGFPVPVSDLKRRRRTPTPSVQNVTEGSNDSVESIAVNAGTSQRPPVPTVSWGDDDIGDCCADSLSERLADSEPDPIPSPTSLGLHDCTL